MPEEVIRRMGESFEWVYPSSLEDADWESAISVEFSTDQEGQGDVESQAEAEGQGHDRTLCPEDVCVLCYMRLKT